MLFFRKKVERMLNFQKEKAEEDAKQYSEFQNSEVEKFSFDDIVAVILSAMLVFGPVALVLGGLVYLAFKWLI